MCVDVRVGDEPGPDAAPDFQRLAEEERDLGIARREMPDAQDDDQQQQLPEAQAGGTGFE
ncbi:hypothetical protein D3C71_2232490 [compost metagenome]